MDKGVIDRAVASARERTIFIFGLVLLLGYVGIFGLVYVTMSPFKRLAKWVSALGRGETQEEMEFDSSDEIGEIAQAFNEITEKFRKSQENLAEQERLQKEMQVAQEIQHMLLPSSFPDIEGYEIASYYEAAKEVGGDYFDFVEVDKDTIGIVVADVSGKGVPGSLVMTMIRTALRTEARGNKDAADVLARVNDFVISDMKRGMFVTVFYMILDSHTRTISYASAGHNPMILFRGKTRKSYYLNPRGFPIGINLPDRTLFRRSIESDTLQLREGDVLICYTDGITEAMNPQRDRFGDERFLSVIRKYGDLKADPLVDNIRNQISEFTEGFAQSDDITLVAIREKMKAEDVLFNLRSKLLKLVNKEKMSVKDACKTVGVSTSTFYKYKKRFEAMGMDGLKEQTIRSEIEEKHISVEDKAKIFDIIRENPDYGAKRISELLNTEKYGFTEIDEKRVYDELVRSRLNTRELRVAFIERGGRGKRMKPPGTPFLTLDGQVIVESKIKSRPSVARPSITDEEMKLQEKLAETEKISEAMISQKSEGAIHAEDEEKTEASSLLEEFLGLTEVADKKMEMELTGGKEDVFEVPEITQGETEKSSETPSTIDQQKETHPDKEEIDLFMDELNWDLAELEEGIKGSDSLSHHSVEQILNSEEDGFGGSGWQEIEDSITSSAGGELFEEEMGSFFDEIETKESRHGKYIETMDTRFDSSIVVRGLMRKRFFESGQYFYRQGLYAKSIEEFRKAVEIDSTFSEAHQCLGDAYFRLGQLEKAGEAYEKVRQLDPNNINVLENLGVIFANRGDYKKAVWQWGEVLKRNPERRDIIDRIKRMQRVIRQRSI
jgi:serine phosphatase RsbU (regulator of sigma subunit)/tetratricopeptide (TPR) repeat protein/transposase